MSSCLYSVFLLLLFIVQASLQALSLCNMWHVSVCLADVQKHALLIFKVYEMAMHHIYFLNSCY